MQVYNFSVFAEKLDIDFDSEFSELEQYFFKSFWWTYCKRSEIFYKRRKIKKIKKFLASVIVGFFPCYY
jgi:hypothetical protein